MLKRDDCRGQRPAPRGVQTNYHAVRPGAPVRNRLRSLQPFGRRNTAAFDDRPHGAKRKKTSTMVRHNDLLRGVWIPPLLMAPGLSNPQKAMMTKDSDHLV